MISLRRPLDCSGANEQTGSMSRFSTHARFGGIIEAMERHLMMKPWSPCCLLALLLAAPLRADPPAVPPHPTLVLQVGHSGGINTLADSPDGKTLATGGNDGVRLWDVPGGQLQSVLHGFYSIDSPAFSPDGRELA